MDKELQKRLLVSEFRGLTQLLGDRGIQFDALTLEEFEKLALPDEQQIVKELKVLSRTPS